MTKEKTQVSCWNLILIGSAIFACVSLAFMFSSLIAHPPAEPKATEPPAPAEPIKCEIMDTYDTIIIDALSEAYEAAYAAKKVYWIPEDALVAPVPNPACYGETDDPTSLQWLLDEAAELLGGQELLFHTDVELALNSKVSYYLDESIFVITWLEIRNNYIYTFSEVKITHPSQFRRYLGNNEYDSGVVNSVPNMSDLVNAVMASSADYYLGRNHGIIVYEGEVKRTNFSDLVDTCFVDRNGDLILVPAGELITMDEAQAFVDKHDINFSLAFGPILVRDSVRCEPERYYLGEPNGFYPRAALCQMDDLHYVAVMANGQYGFRNSPNIHQFADIIEQLKPKHAYTLDGGQTGTIVMHGEAMNPRTNGGRWISDIIYWGTAIGYEEPEATQPE